jgi:uncharacterized protein
MTLEDLRVFTVARNFPKPTSLARALHRMGFVQADPIRAPARAQDLILYQRVRNYHAGDLERLYEDLEIEEDFFVNYGFVTSSLHRLMHPRAGSGVLADDIGKPWPLAQRKRAKLLLEFVREHGPVHPKKVDEHFSHGTVTNYWGGSSNATTHLLDAMHYRGMLRVIRREKGIRIYAVREANSPLEMNVPERLDALIDTVIGIYAPLSAANLSVYVKRLRFAVPQLQTHLTKALQRAKQRLAHGTIEGVDWFWPSNEELLGHAAPEVVRLLAPFDPLVHDRWRFEKLWHWTYRFEAYTPASKRRLGYYAMPLLWRERVIGWANLSVRNGELKSEMGYHNSQPRERAFKAELDAELGRMRIFLSG